MSKIELIPGQDPKDTVVVSVGKADGDVFTVNLPDQSLRFSLCWESARGGWAQNCDTGETHQFYLYSHDESAQLWLNGEIYPFILPARQKTQRQRGGGGAVGGSGEIKSPMPGTILKIMVEPGASVEANAPLVIMESMKMEMTLAAPFAGEVKQVSCTVGQLVEMNTVLIRLEASGNE